MKEINCPTCEGVGYFWREGACAEKDHWSQTYECRACEGTGVIGVLGEVVTDAFDALDMVSHGAAMAAWQAGHDAARIRELEAEVNRITANRDEWASRMMELASTEARAEAAEAKLAVILTAAHVPHGPLCISQNEADASYLREAARKLEEHYKPFGSNLRATVVGLLRAVATVFDGQALIACPSNEARAEAAEAKLATVRHVYEDWMKATVEECADDTEMILVDLRDALDGYGYIDHCCTTCKCEALKETNG